jgi:hypothetical protein
VLTGGYRPSERVIDAIRRADIFPPLAGDRATVRGPRPAGQNTPTTRRRSIIQQLVADHLDVDRLLTRFAEPTRD